MSLSDKHVQRGNKFIADAIDNYNDFMDDNAGPNQTPKQRVALGMILAGVAIAYAIKELGVFTAIDKTIRAFKAAQIIVKSEILNET